MPLATTHFFFPYLLCDAYQKYLKKKKIFFLSIIAGLAGTAPDLDFILTIIYDNISLHRLYTHNYLVAVGFLIVAGFFYFAKKRNLAAIFTIISFGWASHVFLDNLITPYNLTKFQYGYLDAVVLFAWICWELYNRKSEFRRFLITTIK
ncbi:MAG: metal-dependent hydrolase [Candidatus Woesearchaeota archaeon]